MWGMRDKTSELAEEEYPLESYVRSIPGGNLSALNRGTRRHPSCARLLFVLFPWARVVECWVRVRWAGYKHTKRKYNNNKRTGTTQVERSWHNQNYNSDSYNRTSAIRNTKLPRRFIVARMHRPILLPVLLLANPALVREIFVTTLTSGCVSRPRLLLLLRLVRDFYGGTTQAQIEKNL